MKLNMIDKIGVMEPLMCGRKKKQINWVKNKTKFIDANIQK